MAAKSSLGRFDKRRLLISDCCIGLPETECDRPHRTSATTHKQAGRLLQSTRFQFLVVLVVLLASFYMLFMRAATCTLAGPLGPTFGAAASIILMALFTRPDMLFVTSAAPTLVLLVATVLTIVFALVWHIQLLFKARRSFASCEEK